MRNFLFFQTNDITVRSRFDGTDKLSPCEALIHCGTLDVRCMKLRYFRLKVDQNNKGLSNLKYTFITLMFHGARLICCSNNQHGYLLNLSHLKQTVN